MYIKAKYKIPKMIKAIKEYTDSAQLPILKECCLNNEWNYQYVMELQREHSDLRQAIFRLLTKKEVQLEKAMYTGQNNTGFIFALKQLGWKDQPEPIIVNNTIQNNVSGNRAETLNKIDTETLEKLEELYEQIDKETKDKNGD